MIKDIDKMIQENHSEIIELRWKFHCFLTPKGKRWDYKSWYKYITTNCTYDFNKFINALRTDPSFRQNVNNFIKAKGYK